MEVVLLYFDDCPSWRQADERLTALSDEFDFVIKRQLVDTPEAAEQYNFYGSPTITVNGNDLFSSAGTKVGLSCRIYQTPDGPSGCPTLGQLRSALRPC